MEEQTFKNLKLKFQITAYLILQMILVLILLLLPDSLTFTNAIVMLLLAAILLFHSNKIISDADWTSKNIYIFVIIIITIFFIPAYAAFSLDTSLIVGIAIVIANIVALFITIPVKIKISTDYSIKTRSSQKRPQEFKLVTIIGGSKFHSLDCKMIEGRPKKRLKYYRSAQDALKDGLKPCKLCKAVNYLHQI
jgi:hypothetical protein